MCGKVMNWLIGSSNFTFRGPCIVIYSYNKTNEMHSFFKFIFEIEATSFAFLRRN